MTYELYIAYKKAFKIKTPFHKLPLKKRQQWAKFSKEVEQDIANVYITVEDPVHIVIPGIYFFGAALGILVGALIGMVIV